MEENALVRRQLWYLSVKYCDVCSLLSMVQPNTHTHINIYTHLCIKLIGQNVSKC